MLEVVRALALVASGAMLHVFSATAALSTLLEHLGVGVAAEAAAADTRLVAAVLVLYGGLVALHWGRRLEGARRLGVRVRVAYNAALAAATFAYACALAWGVAESARHGASAGHDTPAAALWFAACAREAVAASPLLGRLYAMQPQFRLVELFDTVVLIDGGAQLTFLHCFHHAASLALARLHVVDETPFQWLTLLTNAWVHVAMYAYYAAVAAGATLPRLKRFVTRLQIAQFVVLLAVYGAVFAARALGRLECYATPRSAVAALALISLYLVLFVRFYARTYAQAQGAPVADTPAATATLTVADVAVLAPDARMAAFQEAYKGGDSGSGSGEPGAGMVVRLPADERVARVTRRAARVVD